MKTLTVLTIFFISFNCFSQCPNSNIVLSSQNDIDNFSTNYPNCTELNINLTIDGTNATDLSPLSNISSINGSIYIRNNSNLTSLTGLSNLATIGSNFYLEDNASLTDITGLNALVTVSNNFYIQNNSNLTNCNIEYICNGSNSNITISNNNTGCNDITEACIALSIIDEEINTVKI